MRIKHFIISIVVLIVVGILMLTLGWRVFGFNLCANPDNILVENIEYNEGIVNMTGTTATSGDYFAGYTYEIKDNNLYIGLKYNLKIFGERDGDFEIEFNINEENINKIYIKGKNETKEVWSK